MIVARDEDRAVPASTVGGGAKALNLQIAPEAALEGPLFHPRFDEGISLQNRLLNTVLTWRSKRD